MYVCMYVMCSGPPPYPPTPNHHTTHHTPHIPTHQAASFKGPKALTVGDKEYTADHILIAVGGQPKVPDIPGAKEHAITSDGFFALEEQPKRVAVIGAGYIAVELAGVLHELGSDTTLFCRGDAPLRGFDDLIQSTFVEEMLKSGIKFRGQSTPKVGARRRKSGVLGPPPPFPSVACCQAFLFLSRSFVRSAAPGAIQS
jgi:NADPH-dependent 2,4-dienoyl-CoA reductase/sulfur reductase-like enzyme